MAAIAQHDALEFLRIMFEQVKILIREIDPARAAMLLELGTATSRSLAAARISRSSPSPQCGDQFVKEYRSLFQ